MNMKNCIASGLPRLLKSFVAVLLMALVGLSTHAQAKTDKQGYSPPVKSFGNLFNQLRSDSAQHIPHKYGLTLNTTDSTPQLFVWSTTSGDSLILYVNGRFIIVGSGTGSGTVTAVAFSNDSLYYTTSSGNTFVASLISKGDSTVAYVTPTQMTAAIAAKLSSISTTSSVVGNGTSVSPVQLSGDAASGTSLYYGFNGSGARGFFSLPAGATSGNPTASIGASVVNGVSPAFMRSDAAPPIGTNAVTNALLAQAPTFTMKGNNTGGTANEADLTISQIIALIGAYTATDTLAGHSLASQWALRDSLALATTLTVKRGLHPVGNSTFVLGDIAGVPWDSTVYLNASNATDLVLDSMLHHLKINFTGDATGDIFYRNSSGYLERLAIGTTNQVLTVISGLPSWQTGGGGGGSPGGSTTQVQFNSSGAFAGSSGLTWSGTVLTASAVTSTNDAIVHGIKIGLGATSVSTNWIFTDFGIPNCSSCSQLTFGGHDAGANNSTGTSNSAFGSLALLNNTTGSNNVAIGQGADQAAITNNYVVAVGAGAGNANIADDNVFVGGLSGHLNTTGAGNVGVGKWTISLNTTGSRNTAIGNGGSSGFTGDDNTSAGNLSLDLAITAFRNTGVGSYSFQQQWNPLNNTGVGYGVAEWNTQFSDTNLIAMGYEAFGMQFSTRPRKNTIGIGAGIDPSSGSHVGAEYVGDIFMGDSSGAYQDDTLLINSTSIAHNVRLAENNRANFGSGSQYITLGNRGTSTTTRLTFPNFAGAIVYDTTLSAFYWNNGTAWAALGGGGGMTNPMTTAGDIIYGGSSGTPTRLAGGTSTFVLTSNGATSAPSWQAAAGGITTIGTFSSSSQANGANISGNLLTFGPADATNPGMVTTGAQTIAGVKTLTSDIVVNGINIGKAGGSGTQNNRDGSGSLSSLTTGASNTAGGFDAGFNITSGARNTAWGSNAVQNITTSSDNTGIGAATLQNNFTGSQNTAVGSGADFGSGSGGFASSNVTAIGYHALNVNQGNNNTALGNIALQSNSTGIYNFAIGTGGLSSNTTGNYNTALGANDGSTNVTGSYNLLIGPWVDVASTSTSNYMSIANIIMATGLPSPTALSTTPVVGQIGFGMAPLTNATLAIAAGTTTQAPLVITPGTNLTTPQNGAIENDGNAFYGTENGVRKAFAMAPNVFSQTANGTAVTGTSAATLIGTGVGSMIVAANTLKVGTTITLHGWGTLSTTSGTQTLTVNFLNSTASTGSGMPVAGSQSGAFVEFTVDATIITTGTSGTMAVEGKVLVNGSQQDPINLSNLAINTTVSQTFDLQALWAATGNTISTLPILTFKVQ